MVILGIVLLVVGLLFGLSLLVWLGLILIVIGLILAVAGGAGHPIGRRHYW